MKANTVNYFLPHTADTMALGTQLALLCPDQYVLFLQGPLGSGKTTFARGFIQQFDHCKHIKSPTYTLVETYTVANRCIFHFDLYRLQNPLELENIGIRDYTLEPAIWLIEWPEQATCMDGASLLPPPDMSLCFSLGPENHTVALTPYSSQGDVLLLSLKKAMPSYDSIDSK
jgi:tRNA threonylcarbamoyladenosine biosynthesis protein TsaE